MRAAHSETPCRRCRRCRPLCPPPASPATSAPPPFFLSLSLTWKRSGVRPSQLIASSTWSYRVESSATRCAPPWAQAVHARFSTSCHAAVSSSAVDLPAQKLSIRFLLVFWWVVRKEGKGREREEKQKREGRESVSVFVCGAARDSTARGQGMRSRAARGPEARPCARAGRKGERGGRRRRSARGGRRPPPVPKRGPSSGGCCALRQQRGRARARAAVFELSRSRARSLGRGGFSPLHRVLELALGADAGKPDGDG